jgi:histidine triad (HIT) family protein
MSLIGLYDDDNIFAKIVRGEAPCHRIWEDAALLAFLDVFPQSRGHALVVPKHAQARNLLEIEPDLLCHLHRGAQIVARGVTEVLRPDGVQVMQFNGAPAGQTVFHIHVHVIPRWSGEDPGLHATTPGDAGELAALAAELRAHFGTG